MKNGLFVLTFVFILTTAGCSATAPSKYYVLSPIKDTTTASFPDADKIRVIGVGPIKFPKYLNRSQLIRLSGDNEVVVEEFNRWAEPLDQNFTRVLRANLNTLLASSYAIDYPWKRAMNVQYQVTLDIHQFEADPGGNVNMKANWAIFNLKKGKLLEVARKFSYSKKIDGIDYVKIVAEQSLALEMLSRDIAADMQRLLN